MKSKSLCRKCGVILYSENWNPSTQKRNERICKACVAAYAKQRYDANPEKARALKTRSNRKNGHRPFNENKECTQYLGVHIAERVLSHVFKDVEVMPMHTPGFDFICNRGKRVDVKSSCVNKAGRWGFTINHNTTADYFLCLAFDNREDLNPLHAWLLPGAKFNHFSGIGISPSRINKWNEYRLDLTKISTCCDTMR